MNSRILDQKTLGAVVAGSPNVTGQPGEIARKIIFELEAQTYDSERHAASRYDAADGTYWCMRVMDLGRAVDMNDLTGHATGRILGELGLLKVRHNVGFFVYWNLAQLEILKGALGVYNFEKLGGEENGGEVRAAD